MSNKFLNSYQSSSKLADNGWITDPSVPDPENLPEPLGWCVLVRPYPVAQSSKSSIILPSEELNFLNHITNIGRVVAVGKSAWNRAEHRDQEGNRYDWVKVGDFISFPKHVGSKRKFKGVSYMMLVDDEIVERLPDPQVFDDGFYQINIPQADLEKYNTIYKKD